MSATKTQYRTYFQKWMCFCGERETDPIHTSISIVLDFLTKLFENGLRHIAINTARSARSALSSVVILQGGETLGNNSLVKRFLRGVFIQRPSLPKYNVTWDVTQVLNYIRSLPLASQLPLSTLSKNLTMLLAVLSGQRGQTIHLLNIQNMSLTEDTVKFRIGDLVKQSRPSNHVSEIVLQAFVDDRKLCIVTLVR